MPMEVIIIGSKEKFDMRSTSNVSVYELLNSLLEPQSVLPSIYTDEELQCLSVLICHNFGIESLIDKKLFASVLSTNLSVIVVN